MALQQGATNVALGDVPEAAESLDCCGVADLGEAVGCRVPSLAHGSAVGAGRGKMIYRETAPDIGKPRQGAALNKSGWSEYYRDG